MSLNQEVRDRILASAAGWMTGEEIQMFADWLPHQDSLVVAGHHASFTHPNDQSMVRPGEGFQLFLTCSTVPLNSWSFARGAFQHGVKFPFVSEKHINKFVGMAPGVYFQYPRYRHLALPPGVDRLQVKLQLQRAIEQVNSKKLELYRDQISRLAFELHRPLRLVLVPIEPLVKALGFPEEDASVWRFDKEGHRADGGPWLPKYKEAVEFLSQMGLVQVSP